MQKKQVLLLGSYGQDNLGDEAILEILINILKDKGFEVSVNSSSPSKIEETFDVKAFSTRLFSDVFKKLKIFLTTNLVIFGGGTLLVEHKDYLGKIIKRPLYLTFLILLASRMLSKKTIFLGVGIETIETRLGRFLAKLCLQLCDVVIVRDANSLKFAKRLVKRKIILGADIVFLQKSGMKREIKDKDRFSIGVAPTYWLRGSKKEKDDFISFQAKLLRVLAGNKRNKIYLVPFNTGNNQRNDIWLCRKLVELSGDGEIEIAIQKSPKEMFKFIQNLDFVVGVRLHACVYALLSGVSLLAISYEQKVKSLMYDFGLKDRVVDPFNKDVFQILKRVDWLAKYDYNHPYSHDRKLHEIQDRAQRMLKFF